MGDEREFKIKITTSADASGARKTAEELGKVKDQTENLKPATDKLSQSTEEAGKASEHAGVSHRALHLIFRQVGEASKGLEVGLMALSGVMLGSFSFGVYAVVAAVQALIGHFERQKEVALEAAKATVQFWTDALQGNADARKAAGDYAEALQKIITNVDTLKQKEGEEEAVLKSVAEQRLKILDAERQAEIAAAKGDKEEEARINARYGQRKSDIELQNEQKEIDLLKLHLEEQTADAMKKEQASAAAEKAKEAGAPGRSEASAAEAALPKLTDELAKLDAARMKPEELAGLRTRNAYLQAHPETIPTPEGMQERARVSGRLAEGETAEQAYSAAQQEFEQRQADIENFKTGTAALAKAAADAVQELGNAVATARATAGEIAKAEAVHGVNVDAAQTIGRIKQGSVIQAAGVPDNAQSRSILMDIQAMEGAAQGQRMTTDQTAMVNHLLAALRAQGASTGMINKLLVELRDMHVDDAQKLRDLWAAIHQVRSQVRHQASPP